MTEELLVKEINILNIDKGSVLAVYVDISNMPPSEVDHHINKIMKVMKPVFKKRDIECLFIPQREGRNITFEAIKKDSSKYRKHGI